MKTYLVGGAVRDQLLGLKNADNDWVVVDGKPSDMIDLGFIQISKNFPVFLHPKTHEEYALSRTEVKIGDGHTGFKCNINEVCLVKDLSRRDLTVNAIAMDINGRIYDPFGGQRDIKHRKLCHINDAFCEDPLRVLRVARFAAKLKHLGFYITNITFKLMQKVVESNELRKLSSQSILKEVTRALNTRNFEVFVFVLQDLKVFQQILKPWNMLTDRNLSPLLNAIKARSNQTVLLSLLILIIKLRSRELIDKILNDLNPQKSVKILALRLSRKHKFFSSIQCYSESHVLKSLKEVNALRDKSAFEDFLTVLKYLYQGKTDALHSIGLTNKIQKALIHNKYYLHAECTSKKEFSCITVTQVQLKIIRSALLQTKEGY